MFIGIGIALTQLGGGARIPAAPANVVLPSVVGSPYVGNTVSADVGSWSGYPYPTFTYDWTIAGASTGITTSTYVIQSGDDTLALRVIVTAHNASGDVPATSDPVTVGTIPVNSVVASISGNAWAGATLTRTVGTWTGTATITITGQWYANGVAISGQTASTYVVDHAYEGQSITYKETGTNAYLAVTGVATNAIGPIVSTPVYTVAPSISGTPNVGSTLTVTPGTYDGTTPITKTYQWYASGVIIIGETATTYLVDAAELGLNITCKETASNTYGSLVTTTNSLGPVTAGATPAMSLPFATSRSLVDTVGGKLVTYSGASLATCYDSTGKLTYKPNNLLTYSNTFASWNVIRTSFTTGVSDPDGGNNATTLTATGANGYIYEPFTADNGTNTILSFYARRRTGTGAIYLTKQNGADTDIGALLTGSWQLFTYPLAVNYGNIFFTTVTSGDEFDLYHVQLEAVTYETTARTYNATTSAAYYGPRFDYNPANGTSRGLLIEEARTNVVLYSKTDVSNWGTAGITVTANSATAPDGTTSATLLTGNSGSNAVIYDNAGTSTSAADYTHSIFVKSGTADWGVVSIWLGSGTAGVNVWFNAQTGAIGSNSASAGYTFVSAESVSVGNGWFRISVTGTVTAATQYCSVRMVDGDAAFVYTNVSGGQTLYIWGAQLEAGSFATSYIPTAASAVTRAADNASMTGGEFSWYVQASGTFVVNYQTFSDFNGNNPYSLGVYTTGLGDFSGHRVGSTQWNSTGGAISFSPSTVNNSPHKIAAAYVAGASASATAVDGNTVTTGTNTPPTVNVLAIGGLEGTQYILNGWISSIDYYNTRLADATLQTLTA
jgi:hypothetical protein